MIIKNSVDREVELNKLLRACIHYFTAVLNQPYVNSDERLVAIDQVAQAIPVMRRLLVAIRTKELEARNSQPKT